MRLILPFLIFMLLSTCRPGDEEARTIQNEVSGNNIFHSDSLQKNLADERNTSGMTIHQWQRYEDSIRNMILNRKQNKTLANSFLQEMYIRNLVTVVEDSLLIAIPFNLHGPDCGAPDCYSTDLFFKFRFDDTLVFPGSILFQEHEHGCVEKETRLTGTFQLVEQTGEHVIYHSSDRRRTLALFNTNKVNGTTAYYFTNVSPDQINGKNVYEMAKLYEEGNRNTVYPFTSWILTTNEYENFLKK